MVAGGVSFEEIVLHGRLQEKMDPFVAGVACTVGEGIQLFHQILTDADGKHTGTVLGK